jgi:hypothetical protein
VLLSARERFRAFAHEARRIAAHERREGNEAAEAPDSMMAGISIKL